MTSKDLVDVFNYLDYRAFLRDFYQSKKERQGLSYRALARLIGIKSPSYLKHVLDGDRNLSPEMAFQFAKGLGLDGDAVEYFATLVEFNQARTVEARLKAHQQLTSFKRHGELFRLEAEHAQYHATWYLPAIRELCARADFRDDPKWIANRLRPKVSEADIERGLRTLFELGLLIRKPDGKIGQGEALISTGPESEAMNVVAYHKTMMTMAMSSIDRFGRKDRDISSLTLCLDAEGLSEIKRRLQRFRRELLELSETAKVPKQVVQINLQLFPLSDAFEEEGSDA